MRSAKYIRVQWQSIFLVEEETRMSTECRLFVEKSRNNSGYRIYDAVVLQGIPNGDEIKVIAPKEFLEKYKTVDRNGFLELTTTGAGPPRIPNIRETSGDTIAWRDQIIKKYG